MRVFETDAVVGQEGEIHLSQLPFSGGQAVKVRVEETADEPPSRPFAIGFHQGKVIMTDDFTASLPDSFWVGANGDDSPA